MTKPACFMKWSLAGDMVEGLCPDEHESLISRGCQLAVHPGEVDPVVLGVTEIGNAVPARADRALGTRAEQEAIRVGTAEHHVAAEAADENIAVRPAMQPIIAAAPGESVSAILAVDLARHPAGAIEQVGAQAEMDFALDRAAVDDDVALGDVGGAIDPAEQLAGVVERDAPVIVGENREAGSAAVHLAPAASSILVTDRPVNSMPKWSERMVPELFTTPPR